MRHSVLARTGNHPGGKTSFYVWDEAKADQLARKYRGTVVAMVDTEEEAMAHLRRGAAPDILKVRATSLSFQHAGGRTMGRVVVEVTIENLAWFNSR